MELQNCLDQSCVSTSNVSLYRQCTARQPPENMQNVHSVNTQSAAVTLPRSYISKVTDWGNINMEISKILNIMPPFITRIKFIQFKLPSPRVQEI